MKIIQNNTPVLVETYSEPSNVLTFATIVSYDDRKHEYTVRFTDGHEATAHWMFVSTVGNYVKLASKHGISLGKAKIVSIDSESQVTVDPSDDTIERKVYEIKELVPYEEIL